MSYVTDKDMGFKKFVQDMKKLSSKPHVKVGIIGDQANESHGGDFTIVEVASVNEFGSKDGHIPELSFIRSAFEKYEKKIISQSEKLLGKVIDKTLDLRSALGLLGETFKVVVQKQIVDVRTPPNAPSTIAQKGSSNPLIDTGRMRSAVNYEVKE